MFHNASENDGSRHIHNRELGSVIELALARLPFDYRMVFTLRELNGLNGAETAETLNISEDNVKMRFSRAKAMLRRELVKMYTPEEVFEFNLIYCGRIVDRVLAKLEETP